MHRRQLLRHLAAGAACLCPICALPARAEDSHWGYDGPGGPADWGKLAPEYGACGLGREQSPVDLSKAIPAMTGEPLLSWKPVALEVVNNGHTIQVNCENGGGLVLDGMAYDLVQFHFHHPSEHTIDGIPAEMEIHFVHRAMNGALAVLGVMVHAGAGNSTLETVWRAMPAKPGDTTKTDIQLQPSGLLPRHATSYRYAGSLTTPPCSEVVSWVVYRQAITASPEQIARFAALFPNNARPVQPQNRRKLLLDIL